MENDTNSSANLSQNEYRKQNGTRHSYVIQIKNGHTIIIKMIVTAAFDYDAYYIEGKVTM